MGSGKFQVDVQELAALANRLDQCTQSMRHASGELRSATTRDLGNGQIDKNGAEFKSSWEYGISQIAEVADAIREGLKATARTYSETDSAIQQALTQGAGRGGSSGGNGLQATPFG